MGGHAERIGQPADVVLRILGRPRDVEVAHPPIGEVRLVLLQPGPVQLNNWLAQFGCSAHGTRSRCTSSRAVKPLSLALSSVSLQGTGLAGGVRGCREVV